MNINLIYNSNLFIEGISKYSNDLFNNLFKRNFNPNLIKLKKLEFNVGNKKIGGWASKEFFSKFIILNRTDVNHSTDHWSLSNYSNVVTIHDIIPYYFSEFYRLNKSTIYFYDKMISKLNNVNYFIVPSRRVYDTLIEKFENIFSNKVINIIPRGIENLPYSIINPYKNNGKIHLITIGDFNKRKRFDLLYDYVNGLKDVELYHIGKISDYDAYHKAMKNNNSNVKYLGYIADSNLMYSYLQYADKFVFNTLDEGQGMPSLEALKLGTQPLVNDIAVHREILGDMPYYYNNKDEFIELIYKSNKDSKILSHYVRKYDNWIDNHIKVYDGIWNQLN